MPRYRKEPGNCRAEDFEEKREVACGFICFGVWSDCVEIHDSGWNNSWKDCWAKQTQGRLPDWFSADKRAWKEVEELAAPLLRGYKNNLKCFVEVHHDGVVLPPSYSNLHLENISGKHFDFYKSNHYGLKGNIADFFILPGEKNSKTAYFLFRWPHFPALA